MRHLRSDYDAIQPWPTKRPHIARSPGGVVYTNESPEPDGTDLPIIPDDEPVFLLRAVDHEDVRRKAGAIHRRIIYGVVNEDELKAERDRLYAWADEMERYAAEHYDGGEVSDVTEKHRKG